ncbi:hypothetical protein fugu_003838 [Takifugu bimaculatus]|uniref:Uncharacterized protein n=1 Tax=Takifugu bimaculatus TaxID=433685 RepID=A0A4Z2BB22_9TELE|nr:hypothetical protein fugu_003838 [Takifugu bimaculatus]
MSIMRTFITQNLNSESSPFRQHLQAGLKKFLVRIRDGCLARVRGQKSKKKKESVQFEPSQDVLEQGIGFVEWLGQLPYCYLAPGHSYQRKKTALLLLSAVLETCTDSWSPDKKKGQPPANIAALINYAKQKGKWDFFCRGKQLILITCLEDSTNEIRELSAWLLLKFFQSSFPDDITVELHVRSKQLLCSPRVQEAQMGALMMKVLLQKSRDQTGKNSEISNMVGFLVRELKEHYLTARADMMLAARTKPIHGVLLALQRCLSESPGSVCVSLGHSVSAELLKLLEDISLLLLGVLYGDVDACLTEMDAPPSFCDMGNAIKTLIVQASGGGQRDEEECVLLSEEHSLVLTCCWVSLKEIGIFLGSLVETMLSESKSSKCCLTKEDLWRASQIFKNILLKCRHWGAVEGCCMGFTKFCVTLLSSGDAEIRDIPAVMLEEGLKVVQSPRFTSVTRRAAGLPMLILCICSAGETSKTRSLLCQSMRTLLETAKAPLSDNWDQTLDLPQVLPHSHTRESISPFNHGHRCGHTPILAFTGVCGSHHASPGPWFRSGSCCASVCS